MLCKDAEGRCDTKTKKLQRANRQGLKRTGGALWKEQSELPVKEICP